MNSRLQFDADAISGPMTGPSTMPAMPAPRHNSQASWRVVPCMVDTRTPPVAVRTNPALRPMNARTATSDHTLVTVKPRSAAAEKASTADHEHALAADNVRHSSARDRDHDERHRVTRQGDLDP